MLLIAAAVARGLIGGDNSLAAAFISVATLVAINYAVTCLTAHWHKAERLLEGRPRYLLREGKIDYVALRREGLSKNDLLAALRRKGVERPSEVKWAVLETTGSITVKQRGAE